MSGVCTRYLFDVSEKLRNQLLQLTRPTVFEFLKRLVEPKYADAPPIANHDRNRIVRTTTAPKRHRFGFDRVFPLPGLLRPIDRYNGVA